MSFKRYVGIDFVDFLIQSGATIAAAIMLSAMTQPQEEIGVSVAFLASLGVLAWRRKRSHLELGEATTAEVAAQRVLDLEERVAELEQGQARVLELEERLDFAERMLVRQREAERLGPGEG